MFCGKCGSFVPDGNMFCSNCGAVVDNSGNQNPGQFAAPTAQAVPIMMTIPQPEPVKKNGMATVGLVFGILAAFFSIASFGFDGSNDTEVVSVIFLVYSLATLGTIFSALGIKRSRKSGGKTKAKLGLILSILSFIVPCLALGMMTYMDKAENANAFINFIR